mmetsp:Transcript_15366/g.28630  ORF Transcript_15366/g.28630 Transcript_15366/m.28630 type:complete len:175 (+) Transcript_15366:178-702(+)
MLPRTRSNSRVFMQLSSFCIKASTRYIDNLLVDKRTWKTHRTVKVGGFCMEQRLKEKFPAIRHIYPHHRDDLLTSTNLKVGRYSFECMAKDRYKLCQDLQAHLGPSYRQWRADDAGTNTGSREHPTELANPHVISKLVHPDSDSESDSKTGSQGTPGTGYSMASNSHHLFAFYS